jgi:[acyl-carrier-protein] S-malonyltransferase
MESARKELSERLASIQIETPNVPVYSNVSARPAQSAAEVRKLLEKQLTSPVRWSEAMQNMIAHGADLFYEVGPGKVLTGLLRRIDRSVKAVPLGETKSLEKVCSSGASG